MTREGAGRSLQVAERKLLLALVDGGLVAAVVIAGLWQWSVWDPTRALNVMSYFAAISSIPLWWGAAALTGCYDLRIASAPWRVSKAVVGAVSLLVGLYVVVYFVAPRTQLPRSVVLLIAAMALTVVGSWRVFYATLFARARFRRRVLLVGAGKSGASIARTIAKHGTPTFEVVGVLSDAPVGPGADLAGYPVLGAAGDVAGKARSHGVSEVVVAVDETVSRELLEGLVYIQEQGIQVTPMSLMHETLTGQVPVEHVGVDWWAALPFDHPQTGTVYSLAKRVLDLAVALPSLVLFGMLLIILAPAVKLDSRGPLFYRQQRVGRRGRPFSMVKLRTMVVDAEPEGRAVWAAERDPRITRVGRLLRATMLDEIPQLYNVVRGEMSIVGPRPERPELVADLEREIPFYRLRHAAAPGMAGWSLLHEGYGRSTENALAKLQFDLYYIKYQSLWLDMQIIVRTLGRGLSFRRAERRRPSDPALHDEH